MPPLFFSTRRHLRILVLLLIAGTHLLPAAELPSAPTPQPTTQSISGIILDSDGESISGARITLTPATQPTAPITTISTDDGRFTFANVPPGPFNLSISATGFVPHQASGELQPGEARELPAITLTAGSTTSIQVTASQIEIAQAQVQMEEKQRVLGVIPNFYVSYVVDPVPLTPRQKFELAAKTLIDPVNFALNGVAAGAEQAANTYSWGQGAQGYAKRYAAAHGTFLTSDLIGNAALPILFKQDPRYFYKGTGSIASRTLYAVANSVICKGDNHHWQPDYSAILGGLAASGISNLYYPAPNRSGAALTFEGAAIGTGLTAVSNIIQEFVVRKLTPHVPPPAAAELAAPSADKGSKK